MIVYEVNFAKYKEDKGISQNTKYDSPAEIIPFKESFTGSIIKACDFFNKGSLLQSAY